MMNYADNELLYEDVNELSDAQIAKLAFECAQRWYVFYTANIRDGNQNKSFIYENQWNDNSRSVRESAGKTCYENNIIKPIERTIFSEQRQAAVDVVLIPMSSDIPTDILQMKNGLLRHIMDDSRADIIGNRVFTDQLDLGYGAFVVDVEQEKPGSINQKIVWQYPGDTHKVFFDPSAQDEFKMTGNYSGYYTLITKREFKNLFPDMEIPEPAYRPDDFIFGDEGTTDTICLIRFYIKNYKFTKVYQLDDGSGLNEDEYFNVKKTLERENLAKKNRYDSIKSELESRGISTDEMPPFKPQKMPKIIKESRTTDYEIYSFLCSRNAVLRRRKYPIKRLPVIYTTGDKHTVNGKEVVVPFAQSAQTSQVILNYAVSEIIDSMNASFGTRILATRQNIANNPDGFNRPRLNTIMAFDFDPLNTNFVPTTLTDAPIDPGLLQFYMQTQQDVKTILGRYDANLGAGVGNVSGVAYEAQKSAGDISVGLFSDNLNNAFEEAAKLTLELMPHVYDTERVITVIDNGGEMDYKLVNAIDYSQILTGEKPKLLNDMSIGDFGVKVQGGISFASQRMSAINFLTHVIAIDPQQLMPLLIDWVVKLSPYQFASDIVKRLQNYVIPPEIVEKETGKKPAQKPPTPQEQMMQMQSQLAQAQLKLDEASIKVKEQEAKNAKDKIISDMVESILSDKQKELETEAEIYETTAKTHAEIQKAQLEHADIVDERVSKDIDKTLKQQDKVLDLMSKIPEVSVLINEDGR